MKRPLVNLMAVVVSVGLIGVAVGVARPGWLPAWARVGGAQPAGGDEGGLYCKEHGVPEKFCTLCHEELSRTLTPCAEHGNLPEAICTRCHPEVKARYRIEMCPKGHGLPRSFCTGCGTVASASAERPDDGWCASHHKPESECRECASNPSTAGRHGARPCCQPLPTVKVASAKLVRQVGIVTAAVSEETHAHRLIANAETAYDANRYAEVSPRVPGFLREVKADLGQAVARGEVLAVVDSAVISAAKTQLLSSHAAVTLAQATAERTRSLARSGAIAGKMELEVMTALNQAQSSAMDAEQRLRNLGFDDAHLTRILRERDTRNLLDIVSPIDGAIVARHAVRGEAVQESSQLFSVADTSRIWLWIDVFEGDIAKVAPGQPVSFTISGADPDGDGLAFLGEVNWVGTEVSDRTRTTRVRAELANPKGRLRANQFGLADIQIAPAHRATVVPRQAVQRQDGAEVVFVPLDEPGSYRPQRVVTRPTDRGDVLEVAWGLKSGQRVVTEGAFLLKTEIRKGAIGAGCCE